MHTASPHTDLISAGRLIGVKARSSQRNELHFIQVNALALCSPSHNRRTASMDSWAANQWAKSWSSCESLGVSTNAVFLIFSRL